MFHLCILVTWLQEQLEEATKAPGDEVTRDCYDVIDDYFRVEG